MTKRFRWVALVGLLVFATGSGGHAQRPGDDHFNGMHLTGLINDHTTSGSGSWEIHGTWTLNMEAGAVSADFSAALTMERSDLYFVDTAGADPNNVATRNAHTHHVSVIHGTVTQIPNGFSVTGPAGLTVITANGAPAPFETDPPTSTLQIDVTGGSLVPFSNITLTFGGAATKHFGSNPLAGVVNRVR